jgi:hypothetical protein
MKENIITIEDNGFNNLIDKDKDIDKEYKEIEENLKVANKEIEEYLALLKESSKPDKQNKQIDKFISVIDDAWGVKEDSSAYIKEFKNALCSLDDYTRSQELLNQLQKYHDIYNTDETVEYL